MPFTNRSNPLHSIATVKVRWAVVALGAIALSLVTALNVQLDGKGNAYLSAHTQILLLCVGWALCIWGLRGRGAPIRKRAPNFTLPLLTLCLLVAFAVRMATLETGIHRTIDEIHAMQAAGDLRFGGNKPVLTPINGVTAFTWVYYYAQWWTTELWGASLTAIRLPSVVLGVLQVLGVYHLGRELWGVRVGLLSAFVLACFPPHVHFSRIGLNNIAEPTFALFAFVALWRGVVGGRPRDLVLAGGLLGITHYFYEGGRLFYSAFAVCWVAWVVVAHAFRRQRMGATHGGRPVWAHLHHYGIAVLALVLVALPVYYVWWTNGTPLFPRLGVVARSGDALIAGGLGGFLQGFANTFSLYAYRSELGTFYRNDSGFILPALTPFFALGVLWCALTLRGRGGLLLWWLIGVSVANLFVGDSFSAPRYVIAFPSLAVVVALGIEACWRVLGAFAPRVARRAMIAIVVACCVGQISYYHGQYLRGAYARMFFFEYDIVTGEWTRDIEDMAFRALKLPPKSRAIAIANGFPAVGNLGSMRWYYGRAHDLRLEMRYTRDVSEAWLSRLPKAGLSFFVEPNDSATLALLAQMFTLAPPQTSPYNIPPERAFLWVQVLD